MRKTVKNPKKLKSKEKEKKAKAREKKLSQAEKLKKKEAREERAKERKIKAKERKEKRLKQKQETIIEVSEKKHDRFSDRELIERMISEQELSAFPVFMQSTGPSLQERGALPAPVRLETELEDVPGEAGEGNEPPYKVPDYATLTNSYMPGKESEAPAEFGGAAENVDYILPSGDPNMVRPNMPRFNNEVDMNSWRESYVGKIEKPAENYDMGKLERKKEKKVFSFDKETDTLA